MNKKELVKITKYKDGTLKKILLEKKLKTSNLRKRANKSFKDELEAEMLLNKHF